MLDENLIHSQHQPATSTSNQPPAPLQHGAYRFFVMDPVAHLLVDVLHHLSIPDEETAALSTHRPTLDLEHRELRVREAAEEIGEHACREMAAGMIEPTLRIRFAPIF